MRKPSSHSDYFSYGSRFLTLSSSLPFVSPFMWDPSVPRLWKRDWFSPTGLASFAGLCNHRGFQLGVGIRELSFSVLHLIWIQDAWFVSSTSDFLFCMPVPYLGVTKCVSPANVFASRGCCMKDVIFVSRKRRDALFLIWYLRLLFCLHCISEL